MNISDQIFLSNLFPLDSRLSNIVLTGSTVKVETQSEYLTRVDTNSRYLGQTIDFISPAGTYSINDFAAGIKDETFIANKYSFKVGINDEDFALGTIYASNIAVNNDNIFGITGENSQEVFEAIDLILFPEVEPTFINPVTEFSVNKTLLRKSGETLDLNLTSTLDRGKILIDNVETQKRSGNAVYHLFYSEIPNIIDGSSDVSGNELPAPAFGIIVPTSNGTGLGYITDFVVLEGKTKIKSSAYYEEGLQPLTSRGQNYLEPLPEGFTNENIIEIIGTTPIFYTPPIFISNEQTVEDFILEEYEVLDDIFGEYYYVKIIYADNSVHLFTIEYPPGTATEDDFNEVSEIVSSEVYPLYDPETANNIELDLMSEIGVGKQYFEIRSNWISDRPLLSIQIYDNEWFLPGGSNSASLSFWTITDVTKNILGTNYDYKKYTYNGPDRGEVKIKLTF